MGDEKGPDRKREDRPPEAHDRPDKKKSLKRLKSDVEKYNVHPELSLANFDKLITKNKKPVILDVNATWCHPCRKLAQILNELNVLFHDQIDIVTFTQDKNPEKEKIEEKIPHAASSSIPLVLFFKDGREHESSLPSGIPSVLAIINILKGMGLIVSPEQEEKVYLVMARQQPERVFSTPADIPTQYREACLNVAVERDPPGGIFQYHQYESLPFAKNILRKAVFGSRDVDYYNPTGGNSLEQYSLSMHADIFGEESYAESILVEAAGKNPEFAMRNFEKYAKFPYALRVLKAAGDKDPGEFLFLYVLIKKQTPPDKTVQVEALFEEFVKETARSNHEAFSWVGSQIAKHTIDGVPGLQFFDQTVDSDPTIIISRPRLYADIPGAEARLRKAIEKAITVAPAAILENQGDLFGYHGELNDSEYEKSVLRRVIESAPPEVVLKNLFSFHTDEYIPLILEQAERRDPKALFDNLDQWRYKVESKEAVLEILKRHAKKFPKEFKKAKAELSEEESY